MTPDLKALALEIQKFDPTGKITIALTSAHILQFENEVLEKAARVAEKHDLDIMSSTHADVERRASIAAAVRSLKTKGPT